MAFRSSSAVQTRTDAPATSCSAPRKPISRSDSEKRFRGTCLLLLDDVDASLDVGEGVHGGEDGLPLVLLAQLAARPPALGEGRGVHEAPQVEVLLEVGQAVLHLVVVEVGLHEGDLDVRLSEGAADQAG